MSIVIPRAVWGPRHDNGFGVIGTSLWIASGKEIWLHHSVTNPPGPDATLEQDCRHMRDFEQIGENRFGGGISYTWVIMPSGRVFQGHDIDRQGSHTYQRNDKSRGVCLAGNYDVNALPDKMAASAAALLQELGATIDGPHSDVFPTACPGRYAKARIQEINAAASGGAPIKGDSMSQEVVRLGLAGWLKNDLAPGTDQRALLQELLAETEIEITPDSGAPWKDRIGSVVGAIDRRLVRVEKAAEDLSSSGVPVDVRLSDEDVDRVAERLAEKLSARMQD